RAFHVTGVQTCALPILTTDGVAGYEIASVLGEVLATATGAEQGGAPQPGHGGSSATFRVTGEQPSAGLAAARREAVDRLREEARRKGANRSEERRVGKE